VAKFNQLLRIEWQLGSQARYAAGIQGRRSGFRVVAYGLARNGEEGNSLCI